jgi:hypothetical protein
MSELNLLAKNRRRLLALLLVILLFVAYQVYYSQKLHVVGTDPSTKKFATSAPVFQINFNKLLSNSGLSLTSSPQIIKDQKISGKSLVIVLKSPLQTDQQYSITINKIYGLKGQVVSNKVFTFKPKLVDYKDLSKNQQQILIQGQTNKSGSVEGVNFVYMDNLFDYGVTKYQLSSLKQAVLKYAPSAKTVTVNTSSIKPQPHDPSSDFELINFNLQIDKSSYSSKIKLSNITELELFLYNSSGVQVYDSGVIKG